MSASSRSQALVPERAWQRRPMTLDDLDAVMAIEQVVYPFAWTRGNFRDSLAAGYDAQVLLERGGPLRAYSVAMDGVGETHLLNLTVAPDWRRQGLARVLLDALAARAHACGYTCIWLEVRLSNERALDIYRRYGFVEVGLRRGYYPAAGGRREDARVMQLMLAAKQEGAVA